jgi:hypothetical protein
MYKNRYRLLFYVQLLLLPVTMNAQSFYSLLDNETQLYGSIYPKNNQNEIHLYGELGLLFESMDFNLWSIQYRFEPYIFNYVISRATSNVRNQDGYISHYFVGNHIIRTNFFVNNKIALNAGIVFADYYLNDSFGDLGALVTSGLVLGFNYELTDELLFTTTLQWSKALGRFKLHPGDQVDFKKPNFIELDALLRWNRFSISCNTINVLDKNRLLIKFGYWYNIVRDY